MRLFVDVFERLYVLMLSAAFLITFAPLFGHHPRFMLLAIAELLAAVLILIRKPGAVDLSPYAIAIAMIGTGFPLLVRPGGLAVFPLAATVLMAVGVCLSIWAKLSLNRSFGIIAANRGIKTSGPYRFVRHPMYLGYIVTQAGFLIGSFSLWNIAIYAVAWSFQLLRLHAEERVLIADPAYAAMASKARLVPGLY